MNRFERVFRIFSTRILDWCGITVLLLVVTMHAQTEQGRTRGEDPIPQPATSAIFAAFDRYEVVAMPAAHGVKDVDDFILSLIRDPRFPGKVNDIEVECGNSLYQPVLDRYIAGEEVPFTEVRKVWRNTTQPMCGYSGFFEQFFPLVRAINQKLPTAKRLRVLAGDPPRDWDKIKTSEEAMNTADREASIVSVMEKEVVSKHHKALMLFGPFHLMHEIDDTAVSTYEKDYPNLTFVVSDLGVYDTKRPVASISPFAMWPNPSIALTKGTWLGALSLSDIFPPGVWFDRDCNVHIAFPPKLQKQVQKHLEHFIDAFLYVGPQEFRLKAPMPADIALDADYMTEMRRRESLIFGLPGASKSEKEFNDDIVREAQNPILEGAPPPPDTRAIEQSCLDAKKRENPR
jgi:hypothetical protein